MKKIHIVLVENHETEIEFFTDALKESGLSFLCNTARSLEQAFIILKNSTPDAVFVDANIIKAQKSDIIKKIKSVQKTPVILYSSISKSKSEVPETLNYVQLPGSVQTMARILKNLFIDNEVHHTPGALV